VTWYWSSCEIENKIKWGNDVKVKCAMNGGTSEQSRR
jgi:hypothetical protein